MKILKLSLTALILLSAPAFADLNISVVNSATQAQPIAVVPFSQPSDVSTDIAQIVSADLDRSGLFRSLARSDMLEKPTDVSQINLRNWRAVNVNDVVVGAVSADAGNPGKISVTFSLVNALGGDDASQEVLLTGTATATDNKHWRRAAHQIADQIYEKLTGVKGIFDTRIAYVVGTGYGEARRFMLYVCDADGENRLAIATSHEPLMSPSWSPDGKRLAFVGYTHGRSGIFIQDVDSYRLENNGQPIIAERGINGAPAWSPDGTKLALTLSYESNPDIYVMDLATKSLHRITTDSAIDTEANWSPDGRTLAFISDRGGLPQIYTASADGGPQTRLTYQGIRNEQPRYSPDGKTLALVDNDGSGYRIGLFDLQRKSLRLVSTGPRDEGPNFAPNGQFVVYTTQGAGGEELATVSVDGRVRQVLSDQGNVREPSWSPFRSPE
jgi:TolB protein